MKSFFCAILFLLASIGVSPAQILILDFGPTAVSSSEITNLPYSTGVSSTSTVNKITTSADTSGGLFLSDGTGDSSLSLTFGLGSGTTVTFPTSVTFTSSALGGVSNTGIYEAGAAARDGFFSGAPGVQSTLGLSIGGLNAGTYQIYLSGKNTNGQNSTGSAFGETFFSTVSTGTPTSQDTSGLTGVFENNSQTSSTWATFSQGENYVVLTETITAGQSLNIYVLGGDGTSTQADTRPFLNLTEIVPMSVPEPNAFVLMAAGLVALVLMGRFRVSRRA